MKNWAVVGWGRRWEEKGKKKGWSKGGVRNKRVAEGWRRGGYA
jgi:hypothetical protein